MPTIEDLQNDQGFMSATPNEQVKYLSETDPSFKSAHPDEQAAFLAHVTNAPKGGEELAPAKDVGEALDVAEKHYGEGTGVKSALGRLGTAIPSMARSAYHAVVDEPKNEEETAAANAGDTLGPLGGKIALTAKRMLLDPSVEATQHVNEMAQKQEDAFKAKGQPVPLWGQIAKYAGRGLAAIPMAGPFALGLGERAGKGDVSGALTEAVGYAMAPEALEEAMPGGALPGAAAKGARTFPMVDATVRGVGTGLRTLGEKAPDVGAVIGGTAGALKGNPASAYFEMKGGHYAGKLVGKPLEKLGSKLENTGLSVQEKAVKQLEREHATATDAADKAAETYHAYDAGREQGIPAPKSVLDAHEKAQKHLSLIEQHLQAAKEAAEASKQPAPTPETPITPEDVEAARPAAVPEAKPQAGPINVKTPGQVQPETFPQTPSEKPQVPPMGATLRMPGNTVRVGRVPRLEGIPERPQLTEGVPEIPKSETKPLGEILPPEKPAKPGRLGMLRVSEGGRVVDTEPELQQKIEEGLQGTAKPVAIPPKDTAVKTLGEREAEAPPLPREDVTVEEPKAAKAETPKKFEEVLPKHEELVEEEEGRSPEDIAKAENTVKDLRDQSLQNLGNRFGLSTEREDYDFSKRSEDIKRHRVDRDRFHKDTMAKLPKDLVDHIVTVGDEWDKEHPRKFDEPALNQEGRAERAEEIVKEAKKRWQDDHAARGQKGGAPEEGELEKRAKETVGTAEGAKQDTAFFAQAREENPKGSFSDWAKRAQELKEEYKKSAPTISNQVAAHSANGGSTFHPEKGDLNGKPFFSVGGEPEFREPALKMKTDGPDLTEAQLKEFTERPEVKAALAKHPDASVGTWFDKDAGQTITELVKTPADREEAINMGTRNGEKAIYDLKEGKEIPTGGTGEGPSEGKLKPYKDMTPEEQEELAKKGQSGGSQGAKPETSKPVPTGDALIKKYGESDGDPMHTAFILSDGRGIAQTGVEHSIMTGGLKNLPKFINDEGAVRMRSMGAYGNRQFNISLPEDGITTDTLKELQRMAPQMATGRMYIEAVNPEGVFGKRVKGGYKELDYGKVSADSIEQAIKDLGLPIKSKLSALAEEHLLPEEKEGVTKSKQQLDKFVNRMAEMPEVREFTDAAKKGAGERKWYQRSTQAFDAISKEAPAYFDQPGDRDKFIGLLASSSPQQSVVENMKEALRVWTNYVDSGRPTGEALEKLLSKSKTEGGFTLPKAKVPNAMKALAGEPLWPDITKNEYFKVPSFRDNLTGMLNRVTNDGWMALFSGLDGNDISSPHSYHPISVMTRAAAKELGWEPAEAQAAVWAFIKTLTEKGVQASEDPYEMRQYSEDFADIIQHDPETRALLKDMGVNHAKLDKRLAAIEQKPEPVPSGTSATSEDSARRAFERVEKARGKGTIPAAKTGYLRFDTGPDEATSFEPEKFGARKSPLGKIKKKP